MEPENFVCSSFTQLGCRTSAQGRVETDLPGSESFLLRETETATKPVTTARDMSGVAVGEGLEGNRDASEGGLSFSEDGTCINESKESVSRSSAMASARVKVAFSWAGLAALLSALLQCEQKAPALQKCPSVLSSLAPRQQAPARICPAP